MNNIKQPIQLGFAFDQNFIIPFYVLLTSIFDSNKNNHFQIHAIATGVSQEERDKLVAFGASNQTKIFFYEIDEVYVASFAASHDPRYGLAAFYRLLLPAMLPEDTLKLIYLDVDTIVVGDLAELYNINIDTVPVAAVPDPVDWDRPDLGIPNRDDYFNSGVLLINIRLWKQQNVAERAIKFLKDYPNKATYVDQDALNAVLINNWHKLNSKFNYTYRVVPVAPKTYLDEMLTNKIIIHYNESAKPWHRHSASPLKYLYHKYFHKSPVSHKNAYFPVKISKKYVLAVIKYSALNIYLSNSTIVEIWRKFKPRKFRF